MNKGDIVFHKVNDQKMVVICIWLLDERVACRYYNTVTGLFEYAEFHLYEITKI